MAESSCPACSMGELRRITPQRPDFAERCPKCRTVSYNFGAGQVAASHNDQYNQEEGWDLYLAYQNNVDLERRHSETLDRLRELLDQPAPRVFDVGAGAGFFLAHARERGFVPAGNEIAAPALALCKERSGVDLAFGDDLTALPAGEQDAVTMWCVIAHADDPAELLAGVRHLLRPGGVLFFHTPRWCLIDTVGLGLLRLSGGRQRRLFDRRLNPWHRRLYTRRGITEQVRRAGFEVVEVESAIAYGLKFEAYFTSLGFSDTSAKRIARLLERLGRLGALPRNTLNVYARRSPVTSA